MAIYDISKLQSVMREREGLVCIIVCEGKKQVAMMLLSSRKRCQSIMSSISAELLLGTHRIIRVFVIML